MFCLGCLGERTSQTRQHVQVFADARYRSSTSGTHYRKLFSLVTLLQFLNSGLRHSSSLRLSLLSLLTNTLPGPSTSEVTTLQRYTNLFIIIIIGVTPLPARAVVSAFEPFCPVDTVLLFTVFTVFYLC